MKVDMRKIALNRAKVGSNVSNERVMELLGLVTVPGANVECTLEEAIACGFDHMSPEEAKLYEDDFNCTEEPVGDYKGPDPIPENQVNEKK